MYRWFSNCDPPPQFFIYFLFQSSEQFIIRTDVFNSTCTRGSWKCMLNVVQLVTDIWFYKPNFVLHHVYLVSSYCNASFTLIKTIYLPDSHGSRKTKILEHTFRYFFSGYKRIGCGYVSFGEDLLVSESNFEPDVVKSLRVLGGRSAVRTRAGRHFEPIQSTIKLNWKSKVTRRVQILNTLITSLCGRVSLSRPRSVNAIHGERTYARARGILRYCIILCLVLGGRRKQ